MPVHRLRRRSGTKSALPMPIRRVYLTAAHIMIAQQTRDADPTPGRRLVPAWRESERPYTYKANRDIRPPVSLLVHRLRQWTSIEPARYTGD